MVSKSFPYNHEFFKIFEEICKIPHGSGNTKQLAEWCVEFAKNHGCEAIVDKAGNVIIKRSAAKGLENVEPIIIQGHLDMVCEKEADSNHDFNTDGLKLEFDGKYISANGTTLGADDGVAVAFALSIVADKELQLPALEILLTVDEETGLFGASGLDGSLLSGKKLINLDSEEEGVLLCGCAGGLTAIIDAEFNEFSQNGTVVTMRLLGLAGGHSGAEIHRKRINAAIAMAKLLKSTMLDFRLVSFVGGSKFNAIPCVCTAMVLVDEDKTELLLERIKAGVEALKLSAESPEDKPYIEVFKEIKTVKALNTSDSFKVTDYLSEVIDGVIKAGETGVVTSLNTGISTYKDGSFHSEALIRSMVNNDLDVVYALLGSTVLKYGFSINGCDRYPAWEFNENSPLREKMVEVYEKVYGKKPVVSTIHAGLECGVISEKIKGMDAVSMGPNMYDVHTVNERLDVKSAVRTYEYLLEILKSIGDNNGTEKN